MPPAISAGGILFKFQIVRINLFQEINTALFHLESHLISHLQHNVQWLHS